MSGEDKYPSSTGAGWCEAKRRVPLPPNRAPPSEPLSDRQDVVCLIYGTTWQFPHKIFSESEPRRGEVEAVAGAPRTTHPRESVRDIFIILLLSPGPAGGERVSWVAELGEAVPDVPAPRYTRWLRPDCFLICA